MHNKNLSFLDNILKVIKYNHRCPCVVWMFLTWKRAKPSVKVLIFADNQVKWINSTWCEDLYILVVWVFFFVLCCCNYSVCFFVCFFLLRLSGLASCHPAHSHLSQYCWSHLLSLASSAPVHLFSQPSLTFSVLHALSRYPLWLHEVCCLVSSCCHVSF